MLYCMNVAILFLAATQTFNLPPGLQSAVCYVESHHDPRAMHIDDGGSASIGICEVKLSTARLLGFKGSETELKAPKTNIYYSASYLSYQLRRYHGDVHKAVAAYNAGTWRMSTINAHMAINEKYVQKVLSAWEQGL